MDYYCGIDFALSGLTDYLSVTSLLRSDLTDCYGVSIADSLGVGNLGSDSI
jgi:hypothetical protein